MPVEPRHPYLSGPRPHLFAHRGGDEVAPENTMAAFRHAYDLGYRYLETDVHRSLDGVLVAFHDPELERVAGLSGTIADHTWDELSSIDLGDGHRIPSLEELLDAFGDARFNIDPKADASVEPLAEVIERRGLVDRVCVGSFSDSRIARMLELVGPDLCTSPGPWGVARLGAAGLVPVVGVARRLGASAHHVVQIPHHYFGVPLTRPVVAGFHRLGLLVHVWTVNDVDEMERVLDLGVDGVMSDRVELLASVAAAHTERSAR